MKMKAHQGGSRRTILAPSAGPAEAPRVGRPAELKPAFADAALGGLTQERLERSLVLTGLLLALLIALGGLWLVADLRRSALGQADTYLFHPAPLRLGGVLTLSRSSPGHRWQAWASCGTSAQPVRPRDPMTFKSRGPTALEGAARSIEARLGGPGEDGQTGRDLAWALRHWPAEQVWVNPGRGVLVATGAAGRVACLLVTTVPLATGTLP